MLTEKRQALIELTSLQDATTVLETARTKPMFILGRQVYLNYSKACCRGAAAAGVGGACTCAGALPDARIRAKS